MNINDDIIGGHPSLDVCQDQTLSLEYPLYNHSFAYFLSMTVFRPHKIEHTKKLKVFNHLSVSFPEIYIWIRKHDKSMYEIKVVFKSEFIVQRFGGKFVKEFNLSDNFKTAIQNLKIHN